MTDLRHERVNYIILFFQKYEPANYAEDCTMYSSNKNIHNIMALLFDFAIYQKTRYGPRYW